VLVTQVLRAFLGEHGRVRDDLVVVKKALKAKARLLPVILVHAVPALQRLELG
jgi:hypothetical protein